MNRSLGRVSLDILCRRGGLSASAPPAVCQAGCSDLGREEREALGTRTPGSYLQDPENERLLKPCTLHSSLASPCF